MNRLILVTLILITIVSCSGSSYFDNVDFKNGDKLVFKYEDLRIEDNEFQKRHGHFYISDISTLNSIKGLLKEKTSRPSVNSGFSYTIILEGRDKSYFLGMYDVQKEILFSNSYYALKNEDLQKYSNKFIPFEIYKIKFLTVSSFKKGIELLQQNSFVVENIERMNEMGIARFNGVTAIKTTREAFPNIEQYKSLESIEKKIKKEFSSIDFDYKLVNFAVYDSVEIQIASNRSIKDLIPDGYTIAKPFNENIDLLPIDVYNIKNVDLKTLFESNNVKYELTNKE
ncbi:hypothetical protein [Saccharicrinis aurantiacus]|uniref:hypothetical protein n=1 Tax=Saccharicrinis aurantiacus TaxID=1849719 RepID=UPI00094F89A1|nr:hypothetical protein [Saccharicrinis aurantiacus]